MQLTRLTWRALTRARMSAVVRDLGHVAAAVMIVGLAACDSDDGTPTPIQTPTITITAGAATAPVSPGTPGSIPITLVRGGGYTGDVAIAVAGLPTGVSGVVSPLVLGSGVTTATLTLTAGATAVAGNSTVSISGIGNGVSPSTATFQLAVTIPSAITLTSGSAAISAPQGGTQTVALSVDRSGAFTGAVALTAEGLPTGVTASFAPASLASGVTTSTLTLNAGLAAAIATTPITIRATGTGVTDKTTVIQLSVTASTTPDFALTATPAALTVLPGANAQSTIALTRVGGFAGNVTLATSTLPTGVTATFTPNPATAGTSTLAFTTTAATTPGVYTVTVTGSATGLTSRTVNVVLTVNALPGANVALSSTSATVSAGNSAQSNITITRVGGFVGDVTMVAENLPTGVTATFNPTTVTGTTSALTLATTGAVAVGSYPITIRANGAGGVTGTATFTLTVGAAQNFAVAFTSAAASIVVGGTGSLTANITRNGGFAGTVNFAVTGLPAGITAVVNPAAVTGNTASVDLTVGGSVAPGQYQGSLNGTATGVPNTTTAFTVTVTAVGAGGNISWAFCDATRVPVFFAFRDGNSGAWTRVTPNGSNVFAFSLNNSVAGVAYVLPNGTGFATSVFLQTAAEMQLTANNECISFPNVATKTLTGSVQGINPTSGFVTQGATVTMGSASASVSFGNLNFTLNNVPGGAQDLIAVKSTTNILPTFSLTPDGIIIRRGLNLATGSAITPVLNFGAGGDAVAPVSATITVGNAGADIVQVLSQFRSSNGTSVSFGLPGTSSTATIYGVPSASLVAGDLHLATVFASDATPPTNTRGAIVYFRDLVNKTVTLGPVLNAPTVSAVFNTVLRPRATGTFQAEYQTGIGASYTQSGTNRAVTVTASKGYFGNGANYDLDTPDLAGLSGFQATWGLSNGFTTAFAVNATNAGSASPADGTQYQFASRLGNVPPAPALRSNSLMRR